jgi:hypothetical protein
LNNRWKPGRGKLGFMRPLLGNWIAQADSPMGPLRCRRSFSETLHGSYIRLDARWEFGPAACDNNAKRAAIKAPMEKVYEEIAFIGVNEDGHPAFWSFTSDGKRSKGTKADVTDLHPEAIGFEADMPAGRARMAYWPDDANGFHWVVESQTQKGWHRFTAHHYVPA